MNAIQQTLSDVHIGPSTAFRNLIITAITRFRRARALHTHDSGVLRGGGPLFASVAATSNVLASTVRGRARER
jgi:hypothetical protein